MTCEAPLLGPMAELWLVHHDIWPKMVYLSLFYSFHLMLEQVSNWNNTCLFRKLKNPDISESEWAVQAAAASIYSTCNMVMRAENNVPCFWSHTSSSVSCFADFYLKIRSPFLPLAFVNCDPLSITVVASDVTRRNLRCMLSPAYNFTGPWNNTFFSWSSESSDPTVLVRLDGWDSDCYILSNVELARSMFWLDDYTSIFFLSTFSD